MSTDTTSRNATLEDLAALLKDQQGRKLDVVAPASALRAEGGQIVLAGMEPVIEADGVTLADGYYTPTAIFDSGISDKLGIPVTYLRKCREQAPELYDYNINAWLHGSPARLVDDADGHPHLEPPARPADPRKFLVRCFRGETEGSDGIARAFLSNGYMAIDNLDALTAALDGVRQAGAPVSIVGCELTDSRMYVRVASEAVQALAPTLLKGYRSPFGGAEGTDNPVVFAGFVISNSEVGRGMFTITPRITVKVCNNGLTISKDAVSRMHVGSRLDEGIIRWSDDTRKLNLDMITAESRDAVATFLDVGYVRAQIEELEAKAGAPVSEPQKVITEVGKRLSFTDSQINDVLSSFIAGGQLTAGGVMQAVTAAAQLTPNADTAFDMEAQGVRAMELAAQMSR